jgi:phosphoenolpyruvate carboxykinase (GTP)
MEHKLEASGGKLPAIFCVNWFRKGPDGKFVWPGYGENMRVLKWMIERLEGKAQAEDHLFGLSPRYADLQWDGLQFSPAQFEQVTRIDKDEWKAELALHTALFEQLAYHLPAELQQTRATIEKRMLA